MVWLDEPLNHVVRLDQSEIEVSGRLLPFRGTLRDVMR
jgi:hypothetical protein